jgi:segregation and condensation protein B
MKKIEIKQAVEAILFASEDVISTSDLHKIIDEVDVSIKDIQEAITLLNHEYQNSERSFIIRELAGGWQMTTTDSVKFWIRKLFSKRQLQGLSQRALETVAIIAYNEPITKVEVEGIRGVNSDGIMRSLIEKDLITMSGRKKAPGNPILYKTTKRFLQHFGLMATKDLPNLKEIDELLKTDKDFFHDIKEQIPAEQLGLQFDMLKEKLKEDSERE